MLTTRRLLAVGLAALVLVLVALAGQARSLGADLDARTVEVGGEAASVPDPSNAEPFAPHRFAIVGPVRGDHGALERVFERLDARGGVDLVLLLGDVTHAATAGELRALRATWHDRNAPVLALPGRGDRAPGRAEDVLPRIGPSRFVFVRSDIRFVGVPGDEAADRRFVEELVRPDDALVHTVHLRLDGDAGDTVLATADDLDARGGADRLAFAIADVTRDGIVLAHHSVSRRATLAAYRRDLQFGVLYPALGGTAAFAVFLGICTLALGGSWWIARGPRETVVRS